MLKGQSMESPTFILGTGRCGSTVFHRMLVRHEALAYISNINTRFRKLPRLGVPKAMFHRVLLRAGIGEPVEAYPLLAQAFPGFVEPCRDLGGDDVTLSGGKRIRELFTEIQQGQRKERFCYKYTGWPRLEFFSRIFPSARFIHVVRDGRAVANSLLHVPWWTGWSGPENWRWGPLPERYRREWEDEERSFAVLAGIQWKILLDQVEATRPLIHPEQFLEIKYEELMERPLPVFRRVCEYLDLDYSQLFERALRRVELRNANWKWESDLPESEKARLNRSLRSHLEKHGYSQ